MAVVGCSKAALEANFYVVCVAYAVLRLLGIVRHPRSSFSLPEAARVARNCVPFKLNSRERPRPPLLDALIP